MKQSRLLLAIALPLIFLSLFLTTLRTTASPSATFTVNSTVDAVDVNPGDGVCETAVGNGVCTLRAAVMEANALASEDTIQLPSGSYLLTISGEDEDISATGDIDITDDLFFIGNDMATTIIDGNQLDRIFHIFGGSVSISDMTITNGEVTGSSGGGGIYLERDDGGFPGNLTLDTVTISNNRSSGIGTISSISGGGILSKGMLTVTNSLIISNETIWGTGGGIRGEEHLVIQKTEVRENIASGLGGGVVATSMILKDSLIDGNTLTDNSGEGGGLYISGGGPFIFFPLIIEDSIISNNSILSGQGGGIFIGANASLTVSRTKIISNSANSPNGNTGTRGGGIYNESNQGVTIVDTTITGNSSDHDGGGIYIDGSGIGEMILNRVTINQNIAPSQGAGIYNGGTLSLINVTIAENKAEGSFNKEGGGIYNNGTALTLLNSTIVNNEALYGGGIYHSPTFGSATLENTILANNSASGFISPGDPDTHNCFGSITSAGNNLEDGSDCNFSSSGDLSNTNPLLFPTAIANEAVVFIPLSGSPAIDAGSNTNCPIDDQRLVARPIDGDNSGGAVCDIGSVEYDPSQDIFFFTFLPTIFK
ncbi:hypothetical protein MNBD_CHLOROFLEXI01-3122 [hydrothermal vent metagenome]|uniref:CSLREA domain-containing protein n=1 Tax=hydrothermal vent metagenome TaxID=652676 RepID=A0A3B0WG23_9ZZZZ